jgi:hypothetical protein
MSLWKKILGQTDLTPEMRERMEKEKAEKKRRAEILVQQQREAAQKQKEAKQRAKAEKRARELAKVKVFYGDNPSMRDEVTYNFHKQTFYYIETNLLQPNEKVLATIEAEYDKTKKREIDGILVATNTRLIFAHYRNSSQYVEEFDYKKIKGISMAADGFTTKELYLDYNRGRKKFDDIKNDSNLNRFIAIVREQALSFGKTEPAIKKAPAKKSSTNDDTDKYKKLEQIGKLKENGILTEEEFQLEKKKILNS